MNPLQLEARVNRAIDDLLAGRPTEDSRLEFKAAWEPLDKNARHLAAHANAARGGDLIWVIGVDETNRKVCGADFAELANWHKQIQSKFDDAFAPDLVQNLSIHRDSETVVALHFDTSRAPYVINYPTGQVASEVPWREGNSTRSAKRRDLIAMLAPLSYVPSAEVVMAKLTCTAEKDNPKSWIWRFIARLYIVPPIGSTASIAFHRCEASMAATECRRIPFGKVTLKIPSDPTAGRYRIGSSVFTTLESDPSFPAGKTQDTWQVILDQARMVDARSTVTL